MRHFLAAGIAALLSSTSPSIAQEVAAQTPYAELAALPVPVVAGDISDRPYRVIAPISAKIRKATVFSKAVSEAKVYRELWERGRKLGADAVIKAGYGESHVAFTSWGNRQITGYAIKFVTPAEAAAQTKP